MARPRLVGLLSPIAFAAALLSSCGIRLPDTPIPTYRAPVGQNEFVPGPGKEPPDVQIYLLADEWHTGLVFPYRWLLESGFIPPGGFGNPEYVTLSWGDRTAYDEKGLHSPWKFFRALFTPTPSVMELIPADWDVTEVCIHQRIWSRLVPRGTGPDLAAFLNDCSVMGTDGKPIICGTSSWGGGVLLESRHVYFTPRMCNTWTSQAINSMGGSIDPWFAITAEGVIRQAEKPPNNFQKIWGGYARETNPNQATR